MLGQEAGSPGADVSSSLPEPSPGHDRQSKDFNTWIRQASNAAAWRSELSRTIKVIVKNDKLRRFIASPKKSASNQYQDQSRAPKSCHAGAVPEAGYHRICHLDSLPGW